MLYDDSEQLEVRHVISLAHYDVDIYGGGEQIPEGELWIKRNCIRLRQRSQSASPPDDTLPDAKPFFLFSDNCSEKEDFYHAILQSQDQRTDAPKPLKFDTPDLVRLVQQLHASEEYLHTRWINAIVGRVFLAMYKTEQVEQYIWNKITKKISRVPKPALISKINLQKIDMGTLPPFITNPKLRELTVDGDLTVEADVSYKGNFRVEISAIARIELGSRFKAREVTLVLATTLKKLEGHILVRMKPPPSNRLWMTFETAPKMELSLEPIVSSRQITYGVILRAIESRLREVVSETLVLPNWDDIPFKDTEDNPFRGGIWTNDAKKEHDTVDLDTIIEPEVPVVDNDDTEINESDAELRSPAPTEKSIPASFSSTDSTEIKSPRPSVKPKAMRSGSFTSAATPIVNVDSSNVSATRSEHHRERQDDAASAMKTISMSQPTSPSATPVRSPAHPSSISDSRRSTSPAGFDTNPDRPTLKQRDSQTSLSSQHEKDAAKHPSSASLPRNFASNERRQLFNQSINSATAAAKKWFANRQGGSGANTPTTPSSPYNSKIDNQHRSKSSQEDITATNDSQPSLSATSGGEINAPLGSPANPIGRGQPIPEGGVLPSPGEKKSGGWMGVNVPSAASIANLARRKGVGSAAGSPAPTPTAGEFAVKEGESGERHEKENEKEKEKYTEKAHQSPKPPPQSHHAHKSSASSTHSHQHLAQSQRPTHGHERKTSVGTAAMGVRRKSSAVPPSPNPQAGGASGRRQRRSVTESAGSMASAGLGLGVGVGVKDGVLVVEAPMVEEEGGSPVKTGESGSGSRSGSFKEEEGWMRDAASGGGGREKERKRSGDDGVGAS